MRREVTVLSTFSRVRCVTVGLLLLFVGLAAPALGQDHTLVVLSHTNHTVYELDPATGRVLHEFVAPDQPHEAAITADGGTIFASIPMAAFVEIIDGKTFKEKGRIESDYFKRTPQLRRANLPGVVSQVRRPTSQ